VLFIGNGKYKGKSLWEVAWDFWTKGTGKNRRSMSLFLNDLKDFNTRRRLIIKPDGKFITTIDGSGYVNFLKTYFKDFYDDDFDDVKNVPLMLFLGSKSDFSFLDIVYYKRHKFAIP